jgi:hypothetical protein
MTGIVAKYRRKDDPTPLGKLLIDFWPSYEGVVNALHRIALVHCCTEKNLTVDQTMDMLRGELRMDGTAALDPPPYSHTDDATDRDWAVRHANKVWHGPRASAERETR